MSSAPDTMSSGGHAPTIDYSVPLPSQNSGNRIVRLDLDLDPQQDFLPSALAAGQTYAEAAGVSITGSNASVDPEKTIHFLRRRMLAIGFDAESVERSLTLVPDLLSSRRESARLFRRTDTEVSPAEPGSGEVIDGVVVDPILGNPLDLVKQFTAAAQQGTVLVPTVDGSGKGVVTEAPETPDPAPALFLVEKYDVSSFLGDYGMGRTIRTFTLLPGESTTIRLKTWQSSKESIKQSSSIIDSSEQSAKERFANKMQDETTDKRTRSDSQSWAVEAEASASWGFGSASVKASAEGEYHSGREQFARSATEAVSEHARDSSSKRQLSVTSSAETETETGEETSIERAISNVNMRRVLNFVFRELNQTYTTKLHLTNIWVAFTNGRENTWRQVPVAGLRGLLTEFLRPEKVDETAQRILKVAGLVFDADDVPVRVLEVVLYDASTDTVTIEPVTLNDNGELAPPTATRFYRFKRGPLGQDGDEKPVLGVLLSEQTIVMRTDSAIVEALVGQADALDSYAMEIQQAAARRETLADDRESLLQSTLTDIADPKARAKAAALLFAQSSPEPEPEDA